MIRERIQRWWLQRLPLTDTSLLTQRNIYILPTRAGLAYGLTLLLMLLASINYQLNLGYALTFLLAGCGGVSMHLTHGVLRGLTLHLRPPGAVFAGEPAMLEIVVTNPGRQRYGIATHFQDRAAHGPAFAWCDVTAGGQETVHMSMVPANRGWHGVPVMIIETVFPFGLFRAWTVWRPAGRVLAWPRPEQPTPVLPRTLQAAGELALTQPVPGTELDGVRTWRRGDSLRQVVWKKVARTGQLVSRETVSTGSRELWLDWSDAHANDTERRLSRLSAWVQSAERANLVYGLRLPGLELAPANGDAQRRAALNALAQM